MNLELADLAARLGAATLAGCAIGINRDLANKPMGTRTLGLVSLGAASACVAGIQVEGMWEHPDALSRVVQGIIQGIMAGISFIGAGVILRNPQAQTIEGLTTAATVWVAAALGIAAGLAAWTTLILSLAFALVLLAGVGWLERTFFPGGKEKTDSKA
jgi:putative Mg2+ transporter-C (MgtC) family protein